MSDYKKVKLIAIYMYISELYEKELQYTCQRFSNNSSPEFTDAELMTVYLFVITEEQRFQVKQIHRFANDYLFPKLPSYPAFNHRLNQMSETFKFLTIWLFASFIPKDCDLGTSLTDSVPIVTCKGKNRKSKVAREVVDKGYWVTKI